MTHHKQQADALVEAIRFKSTPPTEEEWAEFELLAARLKAKEPAGRGCVEPWHLDDLCGEEVRRFNISMRKRLEEDASGTIAVAAVSDAPVLTKKEEVPPWVVVVAASFLVVLIGSLIGVIV